MQSNVPGRHRLKPCLNLAHDGVSEFISFIDLVHLVVLDGHYHNPNPKARSFSDKDANSIVIRFQCSHSSQRHPERDVISLRLTSDDKKQTL